MNFIQRKVQQAKARLTRYVVSTVDLKQLASLVADRIDMDELAAHLDASEIAGEISLSELAAEIDHTVLAYEIDLCALSEEFALDDLSNEIDLCDLSQHFCHEAIAHNVSPSEVAQHLCTQDILEYHQESIVENVLEGLLEQINYKDLAKEVELKQVAEHVTDPWSMMVTAYEEN